MASKYSIGTKIEISGQETKAANGTFVIDTALPPQPNGDDYWLWRRIGKNGKPCMGNSTANLRGGYASWMDMNAKIVA